MAGHVLQKTLSPSKMVNKDEKKYKEDQMKEILSALCALLNSGGGRLEVSFNQNASNQEIHETLRTIEQQVVTMMGTTSMTMHITPKALLQQIVFIVKKASDLVTVKYNFCLPCQTQVIAVPPNEPIENVKKVLQVQFGSAGFMCPVFGMRKKLFTKGQNLGSLESNNVQYKNLKAQSTKSIKLADRITCKSNKLPSYVSAFANCEGGQIYYGITDHGVVEGEEISEKDKEKITKKVTKTINKMIWPHQCGSPKKGIHWDIVFEPVKDENENVIPSIFVIVIYVAPCPGGVFIEEPESYHIVNDEVKRMSFSSWLMKLTKTSTPTRGGSVPWRTIRDCSRKVCTI